MPVFTSFDGTPIDYADRGEGDPVLLLHGFAADRFVNWDRPGVIDALVSSGRRVIAPDARGHGRSGKPHEPSAYDGDAMVRDAVGLLDDLGIGSCHVVGYSMGSLITLGLLAAEPRVRAAVLGGIGDRLATRGAINRHAIADALEAEDVSTISDPSAKAFRQFADLTGADRLALAAIQRSARPPAVDLGAIQVPVLVLTGADDTLVGPPQGLADRIPGARCTVVGGDHLSAVVDPGFIPAILSFLDSLERTTT